MSITHDQHTRDNAATLVDLILAIILLHLPQVQLSGTLLLLMLIVTIHWNNNLFLSGFLAAITMVTANEWLGRDGLQCDHRIANFNLFFFQEEISQKCPTIIQNLISSKKSVYQVKYMKKII
jgi:hypothetical protein